MQANFYPTATRVRTLIMVSKQGALPERFVVPSQERTVANRHPGNRQQPHGLLPARGELQHSVLPSAGDAGDQDRREEAKLREIVAEKQIDLVVLARYMQVLSPTLCEHLAGRAINIHHSFLPSFGGAALLPGAGAASS